MCCRHANVRLAQYMAKSIDPIEILLRNRPALQADRPLLTDPPGLGAGAFLASEVGWKRTDLLFRDYRSYEASGEAPPEVRAMFGLTEADPARNDLALIFMPPGKRLLQMTISWLTSAMPVDGRIVVVGSKRSGVASAEQAMQPAMKQVHRLDTARHCVLISGAVTRDRRLFDLEEWNRLYSLPVDGRQLQIASLPGVFSDGKLDDGTAQLLDHLQPGKPGRVLDIGCGQGVIGAALAVSFPKTEVVMTDAHASAVASARRTVELNRLNNCTVVTADLYGAAAGQFDLIVTNPPFHQGGEIDRSTVGAMISAAAEHLTEDGSLQLVANRFLPYQRELSRYFREVTILHEDTRFRVWRASGILSANATRSGA